MFTFLLFLALALCAIAAPAFATTDPEQLRTDITNTLLVIVLIGACVVSGIFLFKHEFTKFAGFIGLAIVIIVVVGSKGEILVVIGNWVAGWFGTSVQQ